MAPYSQLIESVFKLIDLPFDAADLGDLALFLRDARAPEGAGLSITVEGVLDERRAVVLAAVAALLKRLSPPTNVAAALSQTRLLRSDATVADRFERLTLTREPDYRMSASDTGLRWFEVSPWPAAYGGLLGHLKMIISLHASNVSGQRAAMGIGGVEILDQMSRILPTRLQYAAASLGTWGGGALNMQYLGFAAVEEALEDDAANIACAIQCGYGGADARDLTDSGLLFVPRPLVSAVHEGQGASSVFGGLPIDEWNIANLPDTSAISETVAPGGLLVDRHYRTAFTARPLRSQALYGRSRVLRDHYADFYAQIDTSQTFRCKNYSAPIIEVGDPDELARLVEQIPIRSETGLFFRGQGKFHPLSRKPAASQLLFGGTQIEPSLPTAASRARFDYEALHFALKLFVQDRAVFDRIDDDDFDARRRLWSTAAEDPLCRLDYAVMALAQHYGLPTHGLDVTRSLDVATWFATNVYRAGSPDAYHKKAVPDWDENPTNWPVIFACQQVTHSLAGSLRNCDELTPFGVEALRPLRQEALFFHGGHGDHQNRLAETVVCAFRLAPGPWPTVSHFEILFPEPSEDPAYALMLSFRGDARQAAVGADRVANYHS